tara:strand:+ start:117 stop:407 length:291 start_codon:yes stop_codon:yes gene_type:complete
MRERVMRDTENYIYFWNVTYKVKKNPNYTGNHYLATCNSIMGNTYPLETTREEMVDQFLASDVNNTTKHGDIIQVVEIAKCFEDRSPKGRFHKDNY